MWHFALIVIFVCLRWLIRYLSQYVIVYFWSWLVNLIGRYGVCDIRSAYLFNGIMICVNPSIQVGNFMCKMPCYLYNNFVMHLLHWYLKCFGVFSLFVHVLCLCVCDVFCSLIWLVGITSSSFSLLFMYYSSSIVS